MDITYKITLEDTRNSIEFYKNLKGKDWSSFNSRFMFLQKSVYNFITKNEEKQFNRNELICLMSYIYITYHALSEAYGHCNCTLNSKALVVMKKRYNRIEVLDIDTTLEPILEQHIKILIHGDSCIRPKSVLNIITSLSRICNSALIEYLNL